VRVWDIAVRELCDRHRPQLVDLLDDQRARPAAKDCGCLLSAP
jgi:hypothetical protein